MKESVKTYSGHYAGAMACSWFFERRLWCRHLCPIGGMNGMFAKLSMTELRAHTGICSGDSRWVIVVFAIHLTLNATWHQSELSMMELRAHTGICSGGLQCVKVVLGVHLPPIRHHDPG